MTNRSCWSAPVEVDVASEFGFPKPLLMRGWVRGPVEPRGSVTPVVYCIAGGGCSTGYFDLEVDGDRSYSMADHFVAAGVVVVALDHVGLGTSDPVDDLYGISPTLLAQSHHAAFTRIADGIRGGRFSDGHLSPKPILTIGVGHSMGGLIATVQQGRHRSFDGLVVLGHGGIGIPDVITAEEAAVEGPDLRSIEPRIEELARIRFHPGSKVPRKKPRLGTFFASDVPASVRAAFASQAVPVLPTCGLTSMIPNSAHAERAAIDVPTFVAFGDEDLIDDYMTALSQYGSLRDAVLFVLPHSGHCHNQASGRQILWDRILAWISTMTEVAPIIPEQ